MAVLRDERQGRSDLVRREAAELLGCVGDELAVEPQQVAGLVELEEHRPAVDVLDRAHPELERRDDPEVAAAAADGPEEVGVLLVARDVEAAVGGHHVRGEEVVAGQAEAPGEVADAAAQRQPADPGGRDDAARGGQTERISRGVHVAPGGAALDAGGLGQRVHPDAAHGGEVDDQRVVRRAESRHAVRPSPYRDCQVVLGREPHGSHHVTGVGRAHDHRRTAVDHGVVHAARLVVLGVLRGGHGSPNVLAQGRQRIRVHEQILASSFHWSQTSGPEVATCRRDPQRCVNGIGIHARPARVDMAGPLDQSLAAPTIEAKVCRLGRSRRFGAAATG